MAASDVWLARLREERENYKPFVEAVERDLQVERASRLAAKRLDIENSVVMAYINGASIADLKRAYDTKDYRTIKTILDKHAAQIALAKSSGTTDDGTLPETWAEYNADEGVLSLLIDGKDATFTVIVMEDDEYLLDYLTGDEELKRKYDGAILSQSDSVEWFVTLWTEVHNKQ